jgi:hypothetical protein
MFFSSLSALNCLSVHCLAAQAEILGVIAWLLHCSFLAVCAKGMAAARPCLSVAMNTQALFTWGACFAVHMHEVYSG